MDETEFDRFAEEYRALHASSIRASGESPEFFSAYKVADVASVLADQGVCEPLRLIDFGAGVGSSVEHFRRAFPDSELTCLDVSRKSLDIGRSRFGGQADFVHFDGVNIPFPDGSFDVAFAACVFHHIPDAEHRSILAEIQRVLRPGGSLFVFEHNPYNPLTVRAVDSCPFDEHAVLIRPGRLRSAVSESGFVEPVIRYRVFFPKILRVFRPFEKWMTWLPFGAQYFVYGRKS